MPLLFMRAGVQLDNVRPVWDPNLDFVSPWTSWGKVEAGKETRGEINCRAAALMDLSHKNSTWWNRLLTYPNMALNPFVGSETMVRLNIMLYDLARTLLLIVSTYLERLGTFGTF